MNSVSRTYIWIMMKKFLRKTRLFGIKLVIGTSLLLLSFIVIQLATLSPVYLTIRQSDVDHRHLSFPLTYITSRNQTRPSAILIESFRLASVLEKGVKLCPTTRRPTSSELHIRKGAWQVACYECSDSASNIESNKSTQTDGADKIKLKKNESTQSNIKTNSHSELVVFSAYYDDRPSLGVKTWLRIVGVAKLLNHSDPPIPSIHCQVWYEGSNSPYITPVVTTKTGRESGYRFASDGTYVQYLYSCELPGVLPVPTHVSVVLGQECSQASTLLPVHRPVRAGYDQQIGICVPISFGQIPAAMFIEWIETYRLLGINEINIYEAEMTNMTSLFDHYTRQGVLRVHHIPSPIDLEAPSATAHPAVRQIYSYNVYQSVKLASPASLNDCMMRNMYRYRYVFVVDLDEFLLPKIHRTIPALLTDILIRRNPGQPALERLSFRNTYFFKESKPDESQPEHLLIARYRMKPRAENITVLPKSFVDPRTCLSIFNHFCLVPLPSLETPTRPRRPQQLDVSPTLGSIYHYRRCELRGTACQSMLKDLVRDDTALRFTSKLRPLVEEVLLKLNISFNAAKDSSISKAVL